jgi:restriction system protein
MAIPPFQEILLPLLKYSETKTSFPKTEAVSAMATHFALSEDELQQWLPSGGDLIFRNRLAWALSYLKRAGLLQTIQRGVYAITPEGKDFLAVKPTNINIASLRKISKENATALDNKEFLISDSSETTTPEEKIGIAYTELRNALADELLEQIKKCPPSFLENLVVKLLVAMGYGGSLAEAGTAIGRSGDEGIDGIIKEDKLGLEIIYLQAKRWEGSVGRPEIQKFVGALHGKKARKGIFITTSFFTQDALSYAENIFDPKVILIDGVKLSELMIDHNVGVLITTNYEIKKINSDFFQE